MISPEVKCPIQDRERWGGGILENNMTKLFRTEELGTLGFKGVIKKLSAIN